MREQGDRESDKVHRSTTKHTSKCLDKKPLIQNILISFILEVEMLTRGRNAGSSELVSALYNNEIQLSRLLRSCLKAECITPEELSDRHRTFKPLSIKDFCGKTI